MPTGFGVCSGWICHFAGRSRELPKGDWRAWPRINVIPESGPGLTLAPGRALADYLVTGAAVAGGRLYAISAAYSTLLEIDLQDQSLRGAWAVPGLVHPVGVAVRGPQLLIAQSDGGVAVLPRPAP